MKKRTESKKASSPDTETLVAMFAQLNPSFKALGSELDRTLRAILEKHGIKYDQVTFRVKTMESFRDKIRRKGYSRFEKYEDLCGARIVLYYDDDVTATLALLIDAFPGIRIEDKRPHKNEDPEFGYSSAHAIVSGESLGFPKTRAEIQVRTILQHGWAQIEHQLQYKGVQTAQGRRKFQKLAALLELTDDTFAEIRDALQSEVSESGPLASSEQSGTSNAESTAPEAAWVCERPGRQQRDFTATGDFYCWAEGDSSGQNLQLMIFRLGQDLRVLTAPGFKEYMAKFRPEGLFAFRQGRETGAVRYLLEELTAESAIFLGPGLPAGVASGKVVVQGAETINGIGAGIYTYDLSNGDLAKVSATGDSPRTDGEWVVWQEHIGDEQGVWGFRGQDEPSLLIASGVQPAIDLQLLSWVQPVRQSNVWVKDLGCGFLLPEIPGPATFLSIDSGRVSFYVHLSDGRYDLVVWDLVMNSEVVRVAANFPSGNSPVMVHGCNLYWEADHPTGVKNIKELKLSIPIWFKVEEIMDRSTNDFSKAQVNLDSRFENGAHSSVGPALIEIGDHHLQAFAAELAGLRHQLRPIPNSSKEWLVTRLASQLWALMHSRLSWDRGLVDATKKSWRKLTNQIVHSNFE